MRWRWRDNTVYTHFSLGRNISIFNLLAKWCKLINTYWKMLFTECLKFVFAMTFHRREKFVPACARYVEGGDAGVLVTLDTCTLFYFADGTHLGSATCQLDVAVHDERRTNFQRCFGILSEFSIGSINVGFPRTHSGTQIAHKRWAHFPLEVCLKAPPSLGQRMHSTRLSGATVHFRQSHCPSGI